MPTTADLSLMRDRTCSFIAGGVERDVPRGGSTAEARPHGADDLVELRARQLRIDGEREHFVRGALRLGAAARLVVQVREAGLKVQRERVVDRRADAALLEMRLQLVATWRA